MSGLVRTALENVEKIFLSHRQYIKAFLLFWFFFSLKEIQDYTDIWCFSVPHSDGRLLFPYLSLMSR